MQRLVGCVFEVNWKPALEPHTVCLWLRGKSEMNVSVAGMLRRRVCKNVRGQVKHIILGNRVLRVAMLISVVYTNSEMYLSTSFITADANMLQSFIF